MSVSPEASALLKREVIHAYKSIPRRGAEAGGLLCGKLTPSVRIEAVVPIAIEHRFGPAYRLSAADKAKFQDALAAHPDAIGWYRSQTRVAEGVLDEDREVAREFFATGESAFLLCVPDAEYHVGGTLHVWKKGAGERVTDLPLGRFSLLEDALQAADREDEPEPVVEVAPAPRRTVGAGMTYEEEPAAPDSRAAALQRSPFTRPVLIGALALTLVMLAVLVFRSAPTAPANSTVHANNIGLGMKVDRQGKGLLVNWDRQSAAVLEATDATFTIKEGTHSKVIRLSASELRNGGVLYTPQTTEDVQVELALHTQGGNFAQSLRIVQDEKPAR